MKVFIPIHERSAEFLIDTLPSIKIQTVHPEMFLEFYSLSNITGKWKPKVKEFCRQKMLESGDEFTIINDCEFQNLYETNYEEMMTFLENNSSYGAVSLFALPALPPDSGHVCTGVIMFRRNALKVARFDLFPKETSCKSIMESLISNGWKYAYLDAKNRCKKRLPAIK